MKLNLIIILAALWFLPLVASAAVSVTSETGGRRVPDLSDRTAASYLQALGALESGNNDMAQGKAGEVGRYQCLKSVWVTASRPPLDFSRATNPVVAAQMTLRVVRQRTGREISQLTPEQFARAWHCPSAKKLNREQRDYVERFCNLTRMSENQKNTIYTK